MKKILSVLMSFCMLFTLIPDTIAGNIPSGLLTSNDKMSKNLNIAIVGNSANDINNEIIRNFGDKIIAKKQKYYDLDIERCTIKYICKDNTYDGAFEGEYILNFDILEIKDDELSFIKKDKESTITFFVKNHPLVLSVFDSNIQEDERKELMLKYVRFVKNRNIDGYIMYVPIFCDKLYETKGETEAFKILNRFANLRSTMETAVYTEYPEAKDQCIFGVPAQKSEMPINFLNSIIYAFYCMHCCKKKRTVKLATDRQDY